MFEGNSKSTERYPLSEKKPFFFTLPFLMGTYAMGQNLRTPKVSFFGKIPKIPFKRYLIFCGSFVPENLESPTSKYYFLVHMVFSRFFLVQMVFSIFCLVQMVFSRIFLVHMTFLSKSKGLLPRVASRRL